MHSSVKDLHRDRGRKVQVNLEGRKKEGMKEKERLELGIEQTKFNVRTIKAKKEGNEQDKVICGST